MNVPDGYRTPIDPAACSAVYPEPVTPVWNRKQRRELQRAVGGFKKRGRLAYGREAQG